MWIIRFKVTGRGAFPLDMLRYDGCYPSDSGSVNGIADSLEDLRPVERTITLCRISEAKAWEPTSARWRSFGWTVSGVVKTRC